jgi:hypothetical protein
MYELYFSIKVLAAGGDLIGLGFSVFRKHTFDEICHINFPALNINCGKQFIKDFARRSDEHSPFPILVFAGCLGDEHQVGAEISLSTKSIFSGFSESALVTFLYLVI